MICIVCGKEFEPVILPNGTKSRSKFCSDECKNKYYDDKYGYAICKKCGKKFKRFRYADGSYSNRLYCPDCEEEQKYVICKKCGKKFKGNSKTIYCPKCKVDMENKEKFRKCEMCGKVFERKRLDSGKYNNQIFCEDCQQKLYNKAHYGTCIVCGKEFEYSVVPSGYISKTLFCSDECYNKYYNKHKTEISEKRRNTLMSRYGVPYACLLPQCQEKQTNIISKLNLSFKDRLDSEGIKSNLEFRLDNYSYDLKLLNSNNLIEINPSITHTSIETGIFSPRYENYHLDKTKFANEHGYRCINIWDWDNWDKIIFMLKDKQKLYARKLQLKKITKQEANVFLNEYHLQGSCYGNSVNLGLYQDDQLIQVMTFGKPRYNKNYQWELLRLCTNADYYIVSGAEKLFKYFLKQYRPISIISYCDISKFKGDVYKRLGFKLKEQTKPQKIWSKDSLYITDNLLRQRGFDQLVGSKLNPPEIYGKGTDNEELMLQHGWLPVYDCGQKVFEYI